MSRYILLILCTFPLLLWAQTEKKNFFEGGILLGFNASQIDGDKLAGYHKVGLNTGVTASFILHKRFYFNMELLFAKKGSRSTISQVYDQNKNYLAVLNYAEIPFYLSYHDKDNKTRVGLGLSYARLFSAKEQIDYLDNPNALSAYKNRDISWLADLQYFPSSHIGFNIRYTYSLLYIRNFPSYTFNGTLTANPYYGDNQYNNSISIRGVYIF